MRPLISVIVPVYNTEKYLRRCVESICAQTYRALEIILINDGSSDQSPAICDALAKEDPRIRVIHQRNAGVSSARNAGLDAAKGAYIAFSDSDDILHPQMIERLYRVLCESGADVSSCEYTSSESEFAAKPDPSIHIFDAVNGIGDMLCNRHVTYSVCGKLFSRAAVKELRFSSAYSHHEDLLFCYEAFLNCERIAHTEEKLYFYFVNEASATRVPFSHKRMTSIDVQEHIWDDIQARYPGTELRKTAEQQFLKVNIYTAMQMARDRYLDQQDFERLRDHIRKRLNSLLHGSLAGGYKLYGCLAALSPRLFRLCAAKKNGTTHQRKL